MKVKTEAVEKLGPVDMGPPQRWKHYVIGHYPPGQECVAVCGNVGPSAGPANIELAGHRCCPDCRRIIGRDW